MYFPCQNICPGWILPPFCIPNDGTSHFESWSTVPPALLEMAAAAIFFRFFSSNPRNFVNLSVCVQNWNSWSVFLFHGADWLSNISEIYKILEIKIVLEKKIRNFFLEKLNLTLVLMMFATNEAKLSITSYSFREFEFDQNSSSSLQNISNQIFFKTNYQLSLIS